MIQNDGMEAYTGLFLCLILLSPNRIDVT